MTPVESVSVSVPGRHFRVLRDGTVERREPGSSTWVVDREDFYGRDDRTALPRAS